ncbi:MAG TPA: hypothetical protein VN776_02940 [Terracidiphilus sp.]|nr:hypothetical protein [Terracidiphilus sp.]
MIEKTEQGKLSWSTGFEDGQFKTLLPEGKLAFVVQVKGDVRKFRMLDDRQEVILENTVTENEAQAGDVDLLKDLLYDAIGKLQGMARSRALQVNEKLATAEKLLAAI